MTNAIVVLALVMLAYANIHFYFYRYYADPESLRSPRYKAAQRSYEVQTIQSRYMASLGPAYRVVAVGNSPYPYDPEITRYLVSGQQYIVVRDTQDLFTVDRSAGEALAFLFFPGNEQYQELIRQRYPGGTPGDVRNPAGLHLFYTYVVPNATGGSPRLRHSDQR